MSGNVLGVHHTPTSPITASHRSQRRAAKQLATDGIRSQYGLVPHSTWPKPRGSNEDLVVASEINPIEIMWMRQPQRARGILKQTAGDTPKVAEHGARSWKIAHEVTVGWKWGTA